MRAGLRTLLLTSSLTCLAWPTLAQTGQPHRLHRRRRQTRDGGAGAGSAHPADRRRCPPGRDDRGQQRRSRRVEAERRDEVGARPGLPPAARQVRLRFAANERHDRDEHDEGNVPLHHRHRLEAELRHSCAERIDHRARDHLRPQRPAQRRRVGAPHRRGLPGMRRRRPVPPGRSAGHADPHIRRHHQPAVALDAASRTPKRLVRPGFPVRGARAAGGPDSDLHTRGDPARPHHQAPAPARHATIRGRRGRRTRSPPRPRSGASSRRRNMAGSPGKRW